jgi:hypothetical protein
MGSFALFLMLTMAAWTVTLWFGKDELISNRQSQSDTEPLHPSTQFFSSSALPSSAPPLPSSSSSPSSTKTTLYSPVAPAAGGGGSHEALPLHQQDDVVEVDLDDDDTETF